MFAYAIHNRHFIIPSSIHSQSSPSHFKSSISPSHLNRHPSLTPPTLTTSQPTFTHVNSILNHPYIHQIIHCIFNKHSSNIQTKHHTNYHTTTPPIITLFTPVPPHSLLNPHSKNSTLHPPFTHPPIPIPPFPPRGSRARGGGGGGVGVHHSPPIPHHAPPPPPPPPKKLFSGYGSVILISTQH